MSDLTASDIELTLDEEFSGLVPRHSANEADEFRKSVEIAGRFNYPILYWIHKGQNLIVDGRHRFELWCALPDDTPIPPPQVREVMYPDREAVRKAILRDRIGRSNLDPQMRKLLIGKLYNEVKASPGGTHQKPDENGQSRAKGQNGPLKTDTAAERVSEETHTPARTVKRYGSYAEALDVIGNVNGKAKADIESGAMKVPQKDVVSISKLDRQQIGKALVNVRSGREWSDGIETPTATKKPESPKRKTKELSPAKLCDQLTRKHFSALVKGIDAVAKINGGKGEHHAAANAALNSFMASLKKMREGQQ